VPDAVQNLKFTTLGTSLACYVNLAKLPILLKKEMQLRSLPAHTPHARIQQVE